jgi:hypothetical protein
VSISTFTDVARFLRNYWARLVAISLAVSIPCLWHPRIEAGDLPSHVYNAWIFHLIKTGQAPGLWLARRWNNVLFDLALSGLGNVVSWGAAEKIATCGAVLIFFWGAFALVCALTRRLHWFLLPSLAIIAYGWTFEMGFMNCYISLGLAFFALALLIRGRGWERGLAAVLAPLIWLAHPLGMALLVALGAYSLLAERLPPRYRLYLFVASALVLVGIHIFIRVHYPIGIKWRYGPHYVHDGFDQLLLYGSQYLLPARLFRAFVWFCLLVDVVRRRHTQRWWSPYLLPTELCVLTLMGVTLLPSGIDTPLFRHMGFFSIGYLTERLSTVAAILVCCLLGAVNPQKWHLVGFATIAVIFFFFLYNDTAMINRVEEQIDRLVSSIPPGQRVVATIVTFPCRNVSTTHVIDRACIAHCFSYENYEPACEQFRIRANYGNPFVMSDWQLISKVQNGKYIVQPHDLPLFEIYQCGSNVTELCVRELAVGDKTRTTFPVANSCTWASRYNRAALLFDLLLAPVLIMGAYARRRLLARVNQAAS